MKALQWDIHTVPPSDIVRLVAVDGILRGYGYGPGTSMMFGTPMGDITVENGQWVVVDDERLITVQDEEPLFLSEQRRTTSMQEDSVEKQQIAVVDAESWADRHVKVTVTEPTPKGSTTQAIRVTEEEAQELYDKLGAYLASKKPPRAPRTDRDRAWDGAMDGGRLG